MPGLFCNLCNRFVPPLRSEVTDDDGQCQEAPEALQTQDKAHPDSGRCCAPTDGVSVSGDDCGSRSSVPRDDKPDDKLRQADSGLACVIKGWPELPKGLRKGILAMVVSQELGG